MISYVQARKEMQAKAREAWFASYSSVLGATAQNDSFAYDGLEKPNSPSGFWARIHMTPTIQEQDSFGTNIYETQGLIYVEVMAPKSDSSPKEKAIRIAAGMREAFVGSTTDGGVWFRRVIVDENMGTDGQHIKVQMRAIYQFKEMIES